MLNVWINGCDGKIGLTVKDALLEQTEKFSLVGGSSSVFLGKFENNEYQPLEESKELFDRANLFIDFSLPEGNQFLANKFLKHGLSGKSILIATTGLLEENLSVWHEIAKTNKVLLAPNTSLGVALTYQVGNDLSKILSKRKYDIEIIETHHRHKIDSPSGTAKFLADAVTKDTGLRAVTERSGKREPDEVGVFAMRGGSIFGEHSIRFIHDDEEITISHRAFSRSLFAKGSLVLGEWLSTKENSFYNFSDLSIEELQKL